MTEREEAYRAGNEARAGFAQRARTASRSSEDTVTRMVNAAVYRYEHERQDPAPDAAESTSDESAD